MTETAPTTVVRLIDVRDSPLEIAEVLAAVEDSHAGAVNLFNGIVRNHDRGQSVDHLSYSAHPQAVERLREVAEQVAAEFEVTALAAVHRVGTLAVGDSAVLVAASAAHRDQAYVASRALIDRLKTEVPIWKHQVFADGTDEWVAHQT